MRNFYKNKNILVTGGAGFIGSHIAQKLCEYGAKVTIIDDLSTGSLDNIKPFCKNVNFLARDISSYKSCVKATKNKDLIFHLAAFVSVPESIKKPALCEKINVEGTANLLDACKKNNVKTFIFSSSAAIYGEKNGICCESDAPCPQSPYAQSKLDGEKLCKEYAQTCKINTACLRYFNVYGDRQSFSSEYSGVVAKFKNSILEQKPITIYGTGEQRRDFVHVSQVVKANLLLGALPSCHGETFNIASGNSITLLELISQLEKETKTKTTEILFKPARSGDIFCSIADCKKYGAFAKNVAT